MSSKNESFNIETLWTSYASKAKNSAAKMNDSVMAMVNFYAPNVIISNDSGKGGQVLDAISKHDWKTE